MLADITDVQTHLPQDRTGTVSSGDVAGFQLSVERVVKGYLVGVYTAATLATWDTPDHTPGIIREVAAKMIAGMWYRERTSEETPGGIEEQQYGQRLYNESIAMLNDIRAGNLDVILVDNSGTLDSGTTSNAHSWPDNTTAPTFTMGSTF